MSHAAGPQRWMTPVLLLLSAAPVHAQTSSIYLKAQRQKQQSAAAAAAGSTSPVISGHDQRHKPLNPELEKVSLFAVKTKPPTEYRVHDLITVIVREQKSYESDARLDTKRDYKIQTQLDEFFRFVNGHLGAATFGDGRPNIDFDLRTEMEGRGDTERSDRLTFRITAEIIDIKPNGLLVLGGKQQITHNEEVQMMTFTGICRSVDVTADNTILSTQIFNQEISVQHSGAVDDSAKRGWGLKLFDWLTPI